MITLNDLKNFVRQKLLETLVGPMVAQAMTDGWAAEEVTAAVDAAVTKFHGQPEAG